MRGCFFVFSVIGLLGAACGTSVNNEAVPTASPTDTATPVPGPPEVVARVPMPGNTDAWVRTPITATFTEPLAESSLAGNVRLLDATSVELAATLSLADGGTTLLITPDQVPPAPNQLRVELTGGVTDLDGDPLVVPADAWTWTLNTWQTLALAKSQGVGVGQVRAALAPDGTPIIVWDEDDDNVVPGGSLFAQQWVDGQWQDMGNLTALVTDMTGPDIAVGPDGRAAVIVSQTTNTGTHPFVYEWDGTSWVRLGNALTFGSQEFSFVTSIDYLKGQPVVAWAEGPEAQVYVAEWSGTTWSLLGGTYISDDTGNSSALSPTLRVAKQGQLLVSWQDAGRVHAREWNGSAWISIGGGELPLPAGTSSAFAPNITRFDDDTPVVGFQAFHSIDNQSHGFVYELVGGTWSPLAPALNEVDASGIHTFQPTVGLNVAGNPFAVWQEDEVAWIGELNGGAWTTSSELNPDNEVAVGVSVVFYSWGSPVVTMSRGASTARTLFMWRHNS